jgi:branched-chain amino acid transport system ATP-binding protein
VLLIARGITVRRANENLALGVADRAYVLETGSITLQGPGSQLLNDPRVKAAFLG